MWSKKRKQSSLDVKSYQLSNTSKDKVLQLFERKFLYNNNFEENEEITGNLFSRSSFGKWEIEDFMKMKSDMNRLKSSLDDKDLVKWHVHTKQIHPARKIMPSLTWNYRAEFCTQAWCKFYEIACNYLDIDSNMPYFSIHLCEAPGAFITSLNQYMFSSGYKGEWRWIGTTLNPYYEGNNVGEMIEDDRFIQHTYDKWYFGVDGTGNLMSRQNMEGLKEMLGDIYINLVTADGSIDCQREPAEQESIVSQLHHCEALTALQILSPGGTFILKMFTMYECTSICLMYLLNRLFAEVHVFKPCCSKGGNSEVYVICKFYKGRHFCDGYLDSLIPLYFVIKGFDLMEHNMEELVQKNYNSMPPDCIFDRSSIPDSFLEQHRECVTLFRDSQRLSIMRNIDLYKELNDEEMSLLNAEQDFCQKCFFDVYKVEPLLRQKRISKRKIKKEFRIPRTKKDHQSFESHYSKRVKLDGRLTGSLTERKQNDLLPWKQKVMTFETYEEDLEEELNFTCWIKNSKDQLRASDIVGLEPVSGQTIPCILSSRFCAGFLIAQAREIIQKVQWLSTKLKLGPDTVLETVKHIRETILHQLSEDTCCDTVDSGPSQNNHVGDKSDLPNHTANSFNDYKTIEPHLNNKENSFDTTDSNDCHEIPDSSGTVNSDNKSDFVQGKDKDRFVKDEKIDSSTNKTETIINDMPGPQTFPSMNSQNEDSKQQETNGRITILNGNNSDSQILKELKSQGLSMDRTLHFYSSISNFIQSRYELVDQEKMLQSITQILQISTPGDLIVIEMGSCLTRFSAGLVYVLYRSFEKIGFLHHHGNYLHSHLVCMSFKGCPIELQEYLYSISDLISTNHSEAVLEIIPIMLLLEDEDFVTFLTSANTRLLQSFITTVIYKERDRQAQSLTS